jgi:lycopene beta-cyclase
LGVNAGAVTLIDGLCSVEVGGTTLFGRRVVDTRPPSHERLGSAPFAQVFHGLEVETDYDTFDPDSALLMSDMRIDGDGIAFDYVLPLTRRRALFEHTVFSKIPPSPSSLDEACHARLRALCGSNGRLLREESGWIPMGLPVGPRQTGPIIKAGMTGGAVRSSSGYAFRRIQAWASACALKLSRGGMPVTMEPDLSFVSFMDNVFLKAMRQNTDRSPGYYLSIVRSLNGDQFARFMSDQATAMDWLRVIAGLPKRDFIAALGTRFFQNEPERISTW